MRQRGGKEIRNTRVSGPADCTIYDCNLEEAGCYQFCERHDETYVCSCDDGYELEGDGIACAGW